VVVYDSGDQKMDKALAGWDECITTDLSKGHGGSHKYVQIKRVAGAAAVQGLQVYIGHEKTPPNIGQGWICCSGDIQRGCGGDIQVFVYKKY
jgi:hypothetical protein